MDLILGLPQLCWVQPVINEGLYYILWEYHGTVVDIIGVAVDHVITMIAPHYYSNYLVFVRSIPPVIWVT